MADLTSRLADLSPEKRALLERRIAAEGRTRTGSRAAVAVIGLSCRLPGADSAAAFWELLCARRDAVTEVPKDRWNPEAFFDSDAAVPGKMTTRAGGFLREVYGFDAEFFGIAPREAERMDPQQRLLLETTWEALEQAGLPPRSLAGRPVGVFVGIHSLSSDYYWHQAADPRRIDAYTVTGAAHSIAANRLSYLLDLRGPSLAVDTACSSSLVAVHLACRSLRARECDIAVVAGVNLMLSPEGGVAHTKLRANAADDRCKTFDAGADGYARGEGCGVVILRRLDQALEDGDPVLALVRGSAVNQDGATNGLTAPNGLAQREVVRQALRDADVPPERITFVETHGTGTALGDPIEVEALADVLGSSDPAAPACVLGAVKTNIGHLEGAAGIAGLIKVVLCLRHGYIPANLHFRSLNPHISLAGTRLRLPGDGLPWRAAAGETKIGGMSSFGFGGTNAHVVVEEFVPPAASARTAPADERDWLPLPLSARTPAALQASVSRCADWLNQPANGTIAARDVGYTAAVRREHYEVRRILVGRSLREWADALHRELTGDHGSGGSYVQTLRPWPGLVFVYSGQGSQWAGMGQQLYAANGVFRAAIDRCTVEFRKHAEWSLDEELRRPGESSRLHSTEIAQPALFAVQHALTEAWRAWGVEPDAVVGHSAGEVAAAWAAGILSFEDAAALIVHRGRLMERTAGQGEMAAVELSAAHVLEAIEPFAGKLELAAMNSPTSSVISGDADALAAVVDLLDTNGVLATVLGVKYAFHSRRMERLQPELKRALADVRTAPARIPIASTVTGRLADPHDYDATYWARNMREPVRFADAVGTLAGLGHQVFVEVGPHATLSSMLARFPHIIACRTLRKGEAEPRAMLEALARLYELGAPIDFRRLYPNTARVVDLPGYPWERSTYRFERPAADFAPDRPATDVHDDRYRITWRLRSRLTDGPPRQAPRQLRRGGEISRRLESWRSRSIDRPDVITRDVERVCSLFSLRALRALAGDRGVIGRERLDRQVCARPASQRLLTRLIRSLEQDGTLVPAPAGWQAPADLDDSVAERQLELLGRLHPAADPVLQLLGRCGPRLAESLRGTLDPLALLFPEDSDVSAEWVYREAPFARAANALLLKGLAAAIERLPQDAVVRVLEVGAGTGATTAELLSVLPPDRTEYVFTDVSPRFLQKARERLVSFPFVRYALLDVERDPAEQGFGRGHFDVIVGANVVHATANLSQSVEHLRDLLAPGGLVMLLEGTEPRQWADLTVGLTDGWWRFADTDRRPDYPLMRPADWSALLDASGFVDVADTPVAASDAESLFQQSILLASTPRIAPHVANGLAPDEQPGTWVILADRSGVAVELERLLAARGDRVVLVPGPGADGGDGRRVAPATPEEFDRLVTTFVEREPAPLRGCVHLWALDADSAAAAASAAGWESLLTSGCGSAMQLIGALARARVRLEHGVWLVTRGAERVGQSDPLAPSQALLWGAGRVIALERPDIWGGLIDLDPAGGASGDALEIAREMLTADGEDQIAVRGPNRYVPRLVRDRPGRTDAPAFRRDRAYLLTGGTGRLGLQIARWMAAAGAGWIVLTSRRGLADENAGVLDRIRSLGAVVEVLAMDVADAAPLAELLASFGGERPTLAGVIHAAGVLDSHPVTELPLTALHRIAFPKVIGSSNLHLLTREMALDFFVLFSSAASVWGSAGLAHYAAANHFMDTLVHERRRLGLPATCINWGWFEGGGTTEEQHEYYGQIGLGMLPSEEALDALGTALTSDVASLTLARVDWNRFKPVYEARRVRPFLEELGAAPQSASSATSGEQPGSVFAERLRDAAPDEARALLVAHVRAEVARVLGVPSPDRIDDGKGFFDLGMDSITSVELRGRLETTLRHPLPVTITLEYPSVRALSQYLAGELGLAAEPTRARDRFAPDDLGLAAATELEGRTESELADLLDRAITEAAAGESGEEVR